MSKNKKISISVIVVLIVLGLSFAYVYTHNPISLKKENIEVEYGKAIPTEASFYVKNDKDVKVKTNISKKDKVKDKDFENTGKYTVTLSKKWLGFNKEKKVTVKVVDTVNPEFTKLPELSTVEGTKIDFNKYVSATDLSGIKKLEADSKTYDFSKAGEYTVKFTAIDNNDNKTVKTCVLKVAEKQADSEVVFTTDKNGNLVATQKAKPKHKSYSSGSYGSSSGKKGGGNKTGGHTVIHPKETGRGKIDGGTGIEYEGGTVPDDWGY